MKLLTSKFLISLFLLPLSACLPKANPMVETDNPPLQGQPSEDDSKLSTVIENGTCAISSSPQPFTDGQSVILSVRSSIDVQSLQLNGQTLKIPEDQMTVNPTDTTEFVALGLTKDAKIVRCSVMVQKSSTGTPVGTTPPTPTNTPQPDCVITADPAKIAPGQAATLKISAPSHATSIILDNTAMANMGQKFVSPASTQTYFGSYTSPLGTKTCQATLVVEASNSNNGGSSGNSNNGGGINRVYYRSCTVTASRNQVMSCPVRCNTGNLLLAAQAAPEANAIKNGGRCDWSRLEDNSMGVWCHGENRSQFTGSAAVCTCTISCENVYVPGN